MHSLPEKETPNAYSVVQQIEALLCKCLLPRPSSRHRPITYQEGKWAKIWLITLRNAKLRPEEVLQVIASFLSVSVEFPLQITMFYNESGRNRRRFLAQLLANVVRFAAQ